MMGRRQIQSAGYSAFVSMLANGEVGQVQLQPEENRLLFTDKEGKTVYKTALVGDLELSERLLAANVPFSGQEMQSSSPLLTFFFTWLLPVMVFVGIGQLMYKRMLNKAGAAWAR